MTTHTPRDFYHSSFQGRIGIARSDITPPVGIYARNWGAANSDVATAVHRPLTLTALTLCSASSQQPLVFVDADLGWWKTPQLFHRFSARLLDALSLPSANLIFALSHTHAAPPLIDPEGDMPGRDILEAWIERLFSTTVQTVGNALESQSDATLDWHQGRCNLATLRDLPDPQQTKDHRVICGFNPKGNPDDYLLVGRVTDAHGELLATLTHYACHPTTLAWDNTAISPDYVGTMRETLQQASNAPALFMLGACGELAPRYQYVGDPSVADKHGKQLGYSALATLQGMEPPGTRLTFASTVESGAALALWQHESRELSHDLIAKIISVELPIKDWPSADELEQQRLLCNDRMLEERLRRKRDIRRAIGDGSTFNLPIHVWKIGDSVLVGSCCEAYSIAQRHLRERFPDQSIVCMNLINGSLGYLPPVELYEIDVYPVWQTPFDRGSLEHVIAAMTQGIEDVLER